MSQTQKPIVVPEASTTTQLLFTIANRASLPGWFMLCALPSYQYTNIIVMASLFTSAVVYVLSLANASPTKGAGFTSLTKVMRIFRGGDAWVLNACWEHYICFDLFVGAVISRDALSTNGGVPYWMVIPCLLMTLMFGPSGFLTYNAVKFYWVKQLVQF
eukprot:CFRG7362T1